MIDDIINKIIIEARESADEFIFTTIAPWCEEKLQRKISKSDLANALYLYYKPKTNFDKWVEDNIKYETIEAKRILICSHYAECSECPFDGMGDCTFSNSKIKAWLESEVHT